jgi:hypothetical protein
VLVRYTHADTVKLWVVSMTGPAACAYCWLGVLTASECGPTTPGPHPAPLASVSGLLSPELSAAVAPEPSSNVQCPVRVGAAAAIDGAANRGSAHIAVAATAVARRRSRTRSGRRRGVDTVIFDLPLSAHLATPCER